MVSPARNTDSPAGEPDPTEPSKPRFWKPPFDPARAEEEENALPSTEKPPPTPVPGVAPPTNPDSEQTPRRTATSSERFSTHPETFASESPEFPLRYSGECPSLPINRPPGFPHIIDMDDFDIESTDITNLTLADGMATFLWNWNLEQFDRFFDHAVEDVQISYEAPVKVLRRMTISRSKQHVIINWEAEQHWSIGFIIEWSESWRPTFCAENRGEDECDQEVVENCGRRLAVAILGDRVWEVEEGGEGGEEDEEPEISTRAKITVEQ